MFWNDRRVVAILFVLCLLVGLPGTAQATSFPEAIGQFAKDAFSDTEAGITAAAASGHPLAPRVIGALQQGQLLFDANSRRVVIRLSSSGGMDQSAGP